MRELTADERNRLRARYLGQELTRRLDRAFETIPWRVKNILVEVMRNPRVRVPYDEATERLGRRPTVVEWMWANHYDWGLVFHCKEGQVG